MRKIVISRFAWFGLNHVTGFQEYVCAFLLFMLVPFSVKSQVSEIRKLQAVLPAEKDSLKYTDILNRVGFLFYERDVDSTFAYTKAALDIARRHRYVKGEADALTNFGVVNDTRNRPQLAIYYYDKALKKYQEIHDTSNEVQLLMNMAMVFDYEGKKIKSGQYFDAAFHAGKNLAHDSIMALLYVNYLLVNSASMKDDTVEGYIDKIKRIAVKYHDDRTIIAADQVIAMRLIHGGKVNKGIGLLKQAVSKALNKQLYFTSLDMIAALGDNLVAADSGQAIAYYKQGLAIAQKDDYLFYRGLFARKLYQWYKRNKGTENAGYYAAAYIRALENEQEIQNSETVDYVDYALKEEKLAIIKARAKYQQGLILILGMACAAGLILIITVINSLRRTKKLNKLITSRNASLNLALRGLETSHEEHARMIQTVAHDLRGPLGGIYSLADLMSSQGGSSEEEAEVFRLIQESSKNMLDLTNNLLVLHTTKEHIKKERLELQSLLHQCVDLFTGKAKEKQQEILLTASPVFICASREKLWRVICNIISNAIKFSPAGKKIKINAQDLGTEVLISIKDEGIGIPADMKEKIFDLHTAAGRSGTHGELSNGMGLAISRRIIEAHEGHIWFESDETGACFFIRLKKGLP